MGCRESRCRAEPGEPAVEEEEEEEEEEEFLMEEAKRSELTDGGLSDGPAAGRHLLDFAQRMSEDVVAQALQLCWLLEERYRELPFIDHEWDYVI